VRFFASQRRRVIIDRMSRSRYAVYGAIASGGMATVHYGRMMGDAGFTRVVAIKKLHAHFALDPDFSAMLLDEGRMAARIRHPNVVATIDVVHEVDDLFLVMEYVPGESLSRLVRAANEHAAPIPIGVAAAIITALLHGLHAAHEATDEAGLPLGIVHRDVSPQNVLVGADGVPRVVDFGVAKARGRSQVTREGQIKGKIPYMAPEQLRGKDVDARADVWGSSVVFWELLTGQRLFVGDSEESSFGRVLHDKIRAPSSIRADVPEAIDAVVLRGLKRFADERFASARDMARAIEAAAPLATASEIGAWVESLVTSTLVKRAADVTRIEGEVPSRVITVTDVTPVRAESSVRARALWAGGAVALLAIGVFVGLRLGRTSAAAPSPPNAVTSSPIPADSSAPASIAPPPPAQTESAAPSATPARTAATSAPRHGRPPARTPSTSHDPRCYTLDSGGIWHIKPECL
jgi:serine/threonine-protein kinase